MDMEKTFSVLPIFGMNIFEDLFNELKSWVSVSGVLLVF